MRIIILILALNCVCQSSPVKTLKKSLHHRHSKVIFDYSNKRFLYAYCSTDHSDNEVDCTMISEKKPYQNNTYTCNVMLKVKKAGNILGRFIKVKSFSDDKAVFIWSESEPWVTNKKYVKFSTVQLKSCYIIGEVEFLVDKIQRDPISTMTIVDYEDRYDVFLENNDFCGDSKLCRVSIGDNGEHLVSKTDALIENIDARYSSLLPIDRLSPDKGMFYSTFRNHTLAYSILRSDGSKILLLKTQANMTSIAASTAQKTIGVCYTTRDFTIQCTQYDLKGKIKLKKILSGFNDVRRIEAVHNVATGGLLIFARQCEGPNCNNIVVKIDSNGKIAGVLKVSNYGCGFSWGYNQQGIIYKNDDDEYCASIVCYGNIGRNGPRHEGHLELVAKCFSDSDFNIV